MTTAGRMAQPPISLKPNVIPQKARSSAPDGGCSFNYSWALRRDPL
ncbi:MAG: hypothetical protein OJF50_002159 [Nitrospira sp.]|nr:hypothetical protein [Nitrospira sp.]